MSLKRKIRLKILGKAKSAKHCDFQRTPLSSTVQGFLEELIVAVFVIIVVVKSVETSASLSIVRG